MLNTFKTRLVCDTEVGDGKGFHYWREDQDQVDDTIKCGTHPLAPVRDFAIERTIESICSAVASGLNITINIGVTVVDKVQAIVADVTNTKYVLVSVYVDDTTGIAEEVVFEKTTGEYGNPPSGKTFEKDLQEFSLVANGTDLVEI